MLQQTMIEQRYLPDKFAIHPDANFNVGLRPVFDVFQKPIMAKKEVYRKDTGIGLSVVSNTYKVRSYEKAINHFNDLILNSKLNLDDVQITDTVDNNGAVYLRNWKFNKERGAKMFDHPEERSVFELQFRSSHNQRFAEDMIAMARYMFCDNQCTTLDWMLHVRTKHNTDKVIEKDYKAIDLALENFFQGEEEKKRWIGQKIAEHTVLTLFKQYLAWSNNDNKEQWWSEIQMKALKELYEKYTKKYGENLFAVFQTATDWSTHVETKGKVYNVQERRNGRVQDMLISDTWRECQSYR
jgi:hypothetical protein